MSRSLCKNMCSFWESLSLSLSLSARSRACVHARTRDTLQLNFGVESHGNCIFQIMLTRFVYFSRMMVKLDSFSPVSQFNASCKVAYFNGKWDLSQVHWRLGRLEEGSKLLWWCEGIRCFRVVSVHPLHFTALVSSNCRLYLSLYIRYKD